MQNNIFNILLTRTFIYCAIILRKSLDQQNNKISSLCMYMMLLSAVCRRHVVNKNLMFRILTISAARPACRVSSFPALFPELAFSTAVGAPRLQDDKYLLKWLKLWLICLNTYWRFKNILVTVISNLHIFKIIWFKAYIWEVK